jgi:hypothetical protein
MGSPYTDSIYDAAQTRHTQYDPSVFDQLWVTGDFISDNVSVLNGAGEAVTISNAIKVTTLQSYVDPYIGAVQGQQFTVSSTGTWRSNTWVTIDGNMKSYFAEKGLSVESNSVESLMLESLGMDPAWAGSYQVLTFWVEEAYLVRPSFNPFTNSNSAPVWNEITQSYDFSETLLSSFDGFAPTVTDESGNYIRPYTEFAGAEAYADWHDAWSVSSYNMTGGNEFPFTGLGFTWNSNTDEDLNGFALSEFIIIGNAPYYFDSLQSPYAYMIPEPASYVLIMSALSIAFILGIRSQKHKTR